MEIGQREREEKGNKFLKIHYAFCTARRSIKIKKTFLKLILGLHYIWKQVLINKVSHKEQQEWHFKNSKTAMPALKQGLNALLGK